MAKKKSKEKPKRELTKRQLSHWERQKKRQRIIFIAGVAIVTAVVLGVTLGWYFTLFRPLQAVVLKIDGTEYKMGYYVDMLKYYGAGSPSGADNVVKNIIQNKTIVDEAEFLGITIIDKEVDEQLKEYDPPQDTKYRDPVRVYLLLEKMRDEYFNERVSETAEHRHVLAMLLESASKADEVKDRIEKGEDFSTLAEELSIEQYTKEIKGDLGWRPEGVISIAMNNQFLEEQAFRAPEGQVTGPIFDGEQSKGFGYWIVKVLERNPDTGEAHVQGILLGSEVEAKEVKEKIDAGENFSDLAKEYSQYEGNKEEGGDFGMVSEGTFGADVEEFIFDTDIEERTVSDPIKDDLFETKGGYWLIKIDGIEERDVDGENRDILKTHLLNEWVNALKENPRHEAENLISDEQKAWAIEQAIR